MASVEVERTASNQRRNVRYNVGMLISVLLTCLILIVGGIVLYVKIDGKISHVETRQTANTHRSQCQNTAFNHLLFDVPLLVRHDANPKDYAGVVKCS